MSHDMLTRIYTSISWCVVTTMRPQCTYIRARPHTCPMSLNPDLSPPRVVYPDGDHVVYPDICWPRVSWYMFSSCGRWLTNASIVWSSIGLTELMDEPIHPHYWFRSPPILSIVLISNINISIINIQYYLYELTELMDDPRSTILKLNSVQMD